VTRAPIKYVVYSHHHYDHIAGGRPFKELGATFVAHRNAKTRLEALRSSYEKWGNCEQFLPGNVQRFCEFWGRGY
jgi:glyoxylase-like metal-dependent hydrolase (beta-lactamase superfamily II)